MSVQGYSQPHPRIIITHDVTYTTIHMHTVQTVVIMQPRYGTLLCIQHHSPLLLLRMLFYVLACVCVRVWVGGESEGRDAGGREAAGETGVVAGHRGARVAYIQNTMHTMYTT
jgi:hypothetical protein